MVGMLLVLSPQKNFTTTTTISDNRPEILNGRVKLIIENDASLTGTFSPADTSYFDKEGDLKESRGNGRTGKIIVKYTSKYDHVGQKLSINAILNEYAFGHVTNSSTMIFKYNKLGHITSSEDYCQPKHICDINLYTYDQHNNAIEISQSNGLGVQFSETLKYNNHLLVEDVYYFYDREIRENQKKTTYKYLSFDKQGNWTQKVTNDGAKKTWLTTRKIIYY